MAGRYWITGVQIGMLRGLNTLNNGNGIKIRNYGEEIDALLNSIIENQLIGDFKSEEEQKK